MRRRGLGLDMFNAVPDAKVASFNDVVKGAFEGLGATAESCSAATGGGLVPLPPAKLVDPFVAGVRSSDAGAAKLKAFQDKWGPTFSALPKTPSGDGAPAAPAPVICLPPLDKYSKLALAQADVGRALAASGEGKRWGSYTADLLKAYFPTSKILPLVKEGQELQYDTPYKVRAEFDKALTALEKTAKAEVKKAEGGGV
jgi:hypothetical protein